MIGTHQTFLTAQNLMDTPAPSRRQGARPGTPIRGPLTWALLCKLEPRLRNLERRSRQSMCLAAARLRCGTSDSNRNCAGS
jgi:hypothetical protein